MIRTLPGWPSVMVGVTLATDSPAAIPVVHVSDRYRKYHSPGLTLHIGIFDLAADI